MLLSTMLMSSSVQIATIYQMIIMCVLVGNDGLTEGKPVKVVGQHAVQ